MPIPDFLRMPDTRPTKWTAQIPCQGFRYGFPRSFVHENTDLPTPEALVLRQLLAFDLPPILLARLPYGPTLDHQDIAFHGSKL